MMKSSRSLSPETIQTVLSKGWMTHDAMWFVSCLRELGIERANRLNRSAIEDYQCGVMYRIESWLKVLGVPFEMTPEIHGCLMHERGE